MHLDLRMRVASAATWRRAPWRTACALVVGAVLTTGAVACSPTVPRPGPGTPSTGPLPTTTSPAPGRRVDAASVREDGATVTSDGVTVWAAVTPVGDAAGLPDLTTAPLDDGAVRLTLRTPAADVSQTGVLRLAPPPGAVLEVLADRSVVVRDGAGGVVAGLGVPHVAGVGTAGTVAAAPLLDVTAVDGTVVWTLTGTPELTPAQVTVDLAARAVRSATWADRGDEGGRSLVVVPTPWGRSTSLATDELLWAQVSAVGPEAATQGVHDQLACHTIGAPDKESWNLEPWRPDVGLLATLVASCNPG